MKHTLKLTICFILVALAICPEVVKAQEAFSCESISEIPPLECEALVALYTSTNGAGWTNQTNWLTAIMPWYGVTVTAGHVTLLGQTNNNLSGPLPVEIGNLTGLKVAYLDSNYLSGSIPVTIGNLVNLERLYLDDNQLTGTIPSELGNLSKLTLLNLYNNQFSGSIPPELGNLSSLWHLLLYGNQLTGTIPKEFGNFASLQSLGLNSNQLTGSIPAELGNISTLQFLNLNDNFLSGSMPAQLGNLLDLFTLNVSNNLLSGGVPAELGNLSQLDNLWLSNNLLSGPLPLTLTNLSNLNSFYFSNTYLCEPSEPGFQTWKIFVSSWFGTGTVCSEPFFKISGHILNFQGTGVQNIALFVDNNLYSYSDSLGYYSFLLPRGTYTVTPLFSGFSFTPAFVVTNISADTTLDFTVNPFYTYLPLITR
jgi:hypothetical protein